MEQLKDRITGLKPDVALWIYCGIPALLLILFLCVEQVGFSTELESLGRTGLQLITGELPEDLSRNSRDAYVQTGLGAVFALVYIAGLIGTAVMGYIKQMTNYKLAIITVVVLFVMLSFGINFKLVIPGFNVYISMVLPGTPIAWFEFLLGLAWVVFAYLRGNERIATK